MDIDRILELKRKNDEQILEAKLQQARDKTRQDMINACSFIISEQIKINTMVLLMGASRA